MPFRPYNNQSDPLQQLFALSQIRADQERRAEQKQQQATNMALDWVRAGGSFKDVRDYLYEQGLTPSAEKMVAGAEKLFKAQREEGVTGELTSPQYVNALAPAFARTANERGQLAYSPEQTGGGLAALQKQVMQRAAMMGAPQAAAPALQQIQLAALGLEQGQREQVAGERRSEAANRRSQQMGAGIAAAADARREAMAIRGEQRATRAQDIELFTKNAATASVADPGATPRLIAEARDRFGDDEARLIEHRLANMTEGALASQALTRQEAQAKVEAALTEGKTVSPRVARLAADGKAGYDPTTGFYYPSKSPEMEKTLSGFSSLHEIQAQAQAAAALMAKDLNVSSFTGTIEDLKKKYAGNETPAFAAYDYLSQRYTETLLRLESGAAIPDAELDRYRNNAPSVAQLSFQNGQLSGAARVRFAAINEDLESKYVSHFDRVDRADVRAALRAATRERISGVEADPNSWYGQLAKPTTAGQAALQELRQPSSQPGAR